MAKSLSFVLKYSKVSSSFPVTDQTFSKVALQQIDFTSKACSDIKFLSHLCPNPLLVTIHWPHYSSNDNRFAEQNGINETSSVKILPSPKNIRSHKPANQNLTAL